ncbi:MAG: glycosyltransferase family 4 protein [Candidatus Dormibacteria bacterium]
MRVVILTEAFDSTGGVEFYLRETAARLTARGHFVGVVAGRADPGPEGVEVRVCPGIGPFDQRVAPAYAALALEQVGDLRPDAVYHHQVNSTWLTAEVARRWPTVRYVHNHGDSCPSGTRLLRHDRCQRVGGAACAGVNLVQHCGRWRPGFVQDIRRVGAMQRASAEVRSILVASEYVRTGLLRQGFPPGRVEVLPYFAVGPEAPVPYRDRVPGRFLFAGRANREKGLEHLCRALPGLPGDWSLEARAGAGYVMPRVRRLVDAAGLNDRVLLPGWAGQGELSRSLTESCLLVLPSLWPEPFGIIGVQALLHGRPVVAYGGGGTGAWLEPGESGIAVDPGDGPALMQAVRDLLDDPGRAGRMGERGRELALARFDPGRHLDRLVQVLEGAR